MRRLLLATAVVVAAAGCGTTKTVVKVRTATTVRTVREVTTIAAPPGETAAAGVVAALFWTERVYTPAAA